MSRPRGPRESPCGWCRPGRIRGQRWRRRGPIAFSRGSATSSRLLDNHARASVGLQQGICRNYIGRRIPLARLLVIKGADEGKRFELTDKVVVVGRDAASGIRLHDTEVSRRHAEFRQSGDGYTVVDAGSANGTFVNNRLITESALEPGDQIAVGQSILVYSTGPAGSVAAPTSNLAEQISLITRGDVEIDSAIIRTVADTEGSRILTQPDRHSPWLKTALANLSVMYEASQAVSHILDLNELLARILELIFRSIVADRGCFLLRKSESSDLEPAALRWRDANLVRGPLPVSRTIVEHVL